MRKRGTEKQYEVWRVTRIKVGVMTLSGKGGIREQQRNMLRIGEELQIGPEPDKAVKKKLMDSLAHTKPHANEPSTALAQMEWHVKTDNGWIRVIRKK